MTTIYYAYLRVSTAEQSISGVSLIEQRRAIGEYAERNAITISQWFEEVESASKGRRLVFRDMMQRLKNRKTIGLVMHKIDRGARSLRDWADIGDLIDAGVDVRFAHDDLDLETRGGRLTADIQAVIAADYIRNLREEVRKGLVGRLHQGLYPFTAPRGYLDRVPGRVKTPDPIVAPLVIEAFRRYATGAYTLQSLADELAVLGLVRLSGAALTPAMLSKMLRSPFYVGRCEVRGITYLSKHQPLVTKELFYRVRRVLGRRRRHKRMRHSFKYRGRLQCRLCGYRLVGETQKGHIYYRCHHCRKVSVREDRIGTLQRSREATFVVSVPFHSKLHSIFLLGWSQEERLSQQVVEPYVT